MGWLVTKIERTTANGGVTTTVQSPGAPTSSVEEAGERVRVQVSEGGPTRTQTTSEDYAIRLKFTVPVRMKDPTPLPDPA